MVDGGVCRRKKVTADVKGLKRLGIDEVALRKGHKDFVVVLVDLERHVLLDMAPERTNKAIKAVIEKWGTDVLTNIAEVSIDLSGNYRGLVHRLMPNAEIVADRFHVMQQLNQELNQARNAFARIQLSCQTVSALKRPRQRSKRANMLYSSRKQILPTLKRASSMRSRRWSRG